MDREKKLSKASAEKKPENVPLYLFRSGKNRRAYEYMGLHKTVKDGKECMVARVWAPRAKEVSLVGNFCNWDKAKYPLEKIDDQVWEGYTDFVFQPYELYKFYIKTAQGEDTYKSDPYARHTETRPGTASRWYLLRSMSSSRSNTFIIMDVSFLLILSPDNSIAEKPSKSSLKKDGKWILFLRSFREVLLYDGTAKTKRR